MTAALAAAVAVFVPMVLEAAISARHERGLRARGAADPPGDVYRAMRSCIPARSRP